MKSKKLTLGIAALTVAISTPAHAELILGLAGTTIVSFDSATPAAITSTRNILGLNAGDSLLTIDFRPQDGLLYAYSAQARIYSFNLNVPAVATATQVVGPFTTSTANGSAATPVSTGIPTGNVYIDFNPMANALRIEDSNDGNFRLPFATAPTVTSLIGDGLLRITTPPDFGTGVNAGYTNNFPGTGSTNLFVLEATSNALFQQTVPNNGTMVAFSPGTNPDIPTTGVGFDVSGPSGVAYASFKPGGAGTNPNLYTVNLTSGAITLVAGGAIGSAVTDIAAPVPEPGSFALLTVGGLGLAASRRRRQR